LSESEKLHGELQKQKETIESLEAERCQIETKLNEELSRKAAESETTKQNGSNGHNGNGHHYEDKNGHVNGTNGHSNGNHNGSEIEKRLEELEQVDNTN
jgi:hypothetical protein